MVALFRFRIEAEFSFGIFRGARRQRDETGNYSLVSKISQEDINRTGVSHKISGSQHTGIVTDFLSCCLVERIDYDNFAWSSKSRAFAEFRLRRSAKRA